MLLSLTGRTRKRNHGCSSKHLSTLVDDNLPEGIISYQWYAMLNRHAHSERWCAWRKDNSLGLKGNDRPTIYLHRAIWEWNNGPIPDGMVIDHINHDALDNRLENLRLCTNAENCRNQVRSNKHEYTSKYTGVYWDRTKGCWHAQIMVDRQMHFIGYFNTEEEAGRARDKVAKELHGTFARLNFPEE